MYEVGDSPTCTHKVKYIIYAYLLYKYEMVVGLKVEINQALGKYISVNIQNTN